MGETRRRVVGVLAALKSLAGTPKQRLQAARAVSGYAGDLDGGAVWDLHDVRDPAPAQPVVGVEWRLSTAR